MSIWGRKKSLEDNVKNSPSVENYVLLIKYLQSKGDIVKAWEYVEKAKQVFSKSKEIQELYVSIAKIKWRPEIERLKKMLSDGSSSSALVQLAEIYKELEEEEESLNLCTKAIEYNQNDDTPHFIIGEIRLHRFYRDLLERDGLIAKDFLEKAFEINPQNYKALISLAKFYLQIGALNKAQQRLKSILLFAPEDEVIKDLMSISTSIEKPFTDDIEILLSTVEQERKLYYDLEQKEQKREIILSPDIFQNGLDSLHAVQEILCLLICDEEGSLIAHYAQGNVDFNIYYEVLSHIYQTVQNSSRQMDIGKFQCIEIDAAFGSICMIVVDNILYTVFGHPNIRNKVLYKELQKFIEKIPVLHEK